MKVSCYEQIEKSPVQMGVLGVEVKDGKRVIKDNGCQLNI